MSGQVFLQFFAETFVLLTCLWCCRMPITVYMKEKGGIIAIAEYGQEYGANNPIQVLYHGFGHYEALQIHDDRPPTSKL